MAAKNYPVPTENHGMTYVFVYATLFFVNALVLYFAHLWFPTQVVMGTVSLSQLWATILVSSKLALIGILTMPFFTAWEIKRKEILTPLHWLAGYLLINVTSIWLLSRFSEVYGLGITSWVVALSLGFVLNLVQGFAMMGFNVSPNK